MSQNHVDEQYCYDHCMGLGLYNERNLTEAVEYYKLTMDQCHV